MAATTEEPVIVAGDEPDSVREVSARTKGLLISVPLLVALGFLLGYPAVIALAIAPVLLVAVALFMVGRSSASAFVSGPGTLRSGMAVRNCTVRSLWASSGARRAAWKLSRCWEECPRQPPV